MKEKIHDLRAEIATLLMIGILNTGLDKDRSEALEDSLRQAFFHLTIAETIYEI